MIICLTRYNGSQLCINTSRISTLYTHDSFGTLIFMGNDDNPIEVKESPKQIMEIIKATYNGVSYETQGKIKTDDALFHALVNYIDAAIEHAMDRGDSADGGMVSSLNKHRMADNLRAVFNPSCPIQGPTTRPSEPTETKKC